MNRSCNLSETFLARAGIRAVACLALTSGVFIQAGYAQDEGETENADSLEEVVVTGSRIQRSTFDTSTPVNMIDQATISESGFSNINDVLRFDPSIGVGLNSANSSPSGLPNAQAGAGFVNLRGLGTDRSLVLVNGRRRVSGSFDSSAVDVSMIPAGLIERVEIITGGASAVYGADAVSGVVNIITKDHMDGLEISVGAGHATEGSGGERVSVDLTGGSEFANGRGSFVFGLSYSKENELTALQRDFSKVQLDLETNPANTGPNDGIPDRIHVSDRGLFIFPYTGGFSVGGTWYTMDPGLRLIDRGEPFNSSSGIGAEGFRYIEFARLRQEQEILAAHLGLDFSVTDGINFFLDADFGQTTSLGAGQPDNTTQGTGLIINRIRRENPLIPADLAAFMDARGLAFINYNQAYKSWGSRSPTYDRESYTVTTGFDGVFSNDWEWEVSFQDGSYENNSKWPNFTITQRVADAIDVVTDPATGQPVCRSRAAGCIPFFPLGNDRPADDVLNYLHHTVLRHHKNEQQIAAATLTGSLFALPAGDLQFAAGLEYREESITTLDDGLARIGAVHLFRGAEPQNADMSVKEAYLEALVPVLADVAMAQQLDIEAAVRFSDYDTIGNTTATKLGLNWMPVESFRLRTSFASSVRAPNLSELFNPGITSGVFLDDPCDISRINLGTATRSANCAALGIPAGWIDPNAAPAKLAVTGGNPNLKEETSDSFAFGTVFTPVNIENLQFSLDYWDIEINDAVSSFNSTDIMNKCVDSPTINNQFCPLITREPGPSYSIARIDITKINAGRLNARGIDFAGQYSFDAWNGDFSIGLGGTYLLDHELFVDENDPATLFITKGNPDNPEFRANLALSWLREAWNIGLNTRYVGSVEMDPNVLTDESIDLNNVPSRVYNDLIVGYEFNDSFRLTGTVTNLLDVDPPRRSTTYLGNSGIYDNTGRYVFVRGTYSF
jgi:iron complex outermembrane receptor protein